tara:strand:- start:72694 stop:72879 length:186 start_codon:yes stop_codon:yes gene_type:complete
LFTLEIKNPTTIKKVIILILLEAFISSFESNDKDDVSLLCIDETLIILEAACIEIYQPFCD